MMLWVSWWGLAIRTSAKVMEMSWSFSASPPSTKASLLPTPSQTRLFHSTELLGWGLKGTLAQHWHSGGYRQAISLGWAWSHRAEAEWGWDDHFTRSIWPGIALVCWFGSFMNNFLDVAITSKRHQQRGLKCSLNVFLWLILRRRIRNTIKT